MSWSDPKRVRRSVHRGSRHIGYLTTITYPLRDVTAFTEGSPYSELVIADLAEEHIAMLQRFKAHWLIQCGPDYATADVGRELSDDEAVQLAEFALASDRTAGEHLANALAARIEDSA